MKTAVAVIAMAIGMLAGAAALAQSGMPPLVRNPQITFVYEQPRHPIYASIYDADDARFAKQFSALVQTYEKLGGVRRRLMKRELLEEFSQFLAPLKLPIRLGLVTRQCGVPNAFYDQADSKLILCYEYVAGMENTAPKRTTPQGITREDAIVGSIVGTMLHEAGHVVSNLLRLPVLGREEDTADQIGAYVALQFGRDVARTLIKGRAYHWHRFLGRRPIYWGPHSSPLQRQHTYLCLAYGADPEGFVEFVKYGWLPKDRADNCHNEYRQVQYAFRTTILPHLDIELMEKVRARKWLRPDDGKRRPRSRAPDARTESGIR